MKLPVTAISNKGKILTAALGILLGLVAIFKRKSWLHPLNEFEECPKYMKGSELIYFGYKYYYRPPSLAEPESGIEIFFKKQDLDFSLPEGFKKESSISLSAGGDLMPYACINSTSAAELWKETGEFFFSSDIVFANLETPLQLSSPPSLVPEVMLNDMHFNGSEEMFRIFNGNNAYKGYDVLATANNHTLDMGEKGLSDTLDFLDQHNILHTGSARTEKEQLEFPVIEKNGIRTAFLAFTFSLNKLELPQGKEWSANYLRLNRPDEDLSQLVRLVLHARERKADIIVASMHMGNAYQALPSSHTVKMMHRIFEETGIDIILGGHPHNPHPMEKFSFTDPFSGQKKDGFCVYSLGDFVAYDIFRWCHLPLMLKLEISRGTLENKRTTLLSGIKLLPVFNYGYRDKKGTFHIRFLDLYKTYHLYKENNLPEYMNAAGLREMLELKEFCDRFVLPGDPGKILLTT
jgi:hypothetical protein